MNIVCDRCKCDLSLSSYVTVNVLATDTYDIDEQYELNLCSSCFEKFPSVLDRFTQEREYEEK